jgi:hypothetical protein
MKDSEPADDEERVSLRGVTRAHVSGRAECCTALHTTAPFAVIPVDARRDCAC